MARHTSRLAIFHALQCHFGPDIDQDSAATKLWHGAARRSIVLRMNKAPCFAQFEMSLQPFACDACTTWKTVVHVIRDHLKANGWIIDSPI